MTHIVLEHLNITVSDAKATAALYCKLFDWHIRWEGPAMDAGYTVHVGTDTQYIALYTPAAPQADTMSDHTVIGKLNHIAITVKDLAQFRAKAEALGLLPFNDRHYLDNQHSFYIKDTDGVEFEIVSYD